MTGQPLLSISVRIAAGTVALLLAAGAAPAELRIGVVSIAQLLDEAPQAKNAMQHLQDEFAPRQREIVAQQQDLREKDDKLQKDAAVMAEAERHALERDLRDGQRELSRRQNEYLEDLNLRRNEELARLQKSLLEEVQAYARAANFDLIVSDALYASDTIDITPQVLKGLEERYEAGNKAAN